MKCFSCSFKEKELILENHLTVAVVPGLLYQKHIFYGEPYSRPYCTTSGVSKKVLKTSSFRYTLRKKTKSSLYMHM